MPGEEIVERGYDLTAKNPNRKDEYEHRPPEELVASILEKERKILCLVDELEKLLNTNREEAS